MRTVEVHTHERLLLRVAEAAEAASVSRGTVYALIAAGELSAIRVGRTLRVPVQSLRDWIARGVAGTSWEVP